ncbi:3-hydroxyisobutyrate dehydrogenase [Streptomyces violarus]|uniref:L-threonate dehydrogenase n=1 Tax=Streptomyces violarus TaxID=67380 RepID=A0A7W4ZJS5_9ACTN|nr:MULTISPECIES: L-threonate dehydrogenase [Streptomyces]MBB3073739.1 3-hydroxyisobutyrate dehydrogenase [Streptomyces violarus]WRT96489.1 L-threonate dehydrogenase [Streptomyces sp. CGMCC 4.1772]GHC96183.1 3-hydroxyisobutyrate dehydrogenase [Streptomyces violarus]
MSDQNEPARPRVGVVGLGAMGLGMAQSLRAAGYDVGVHDLRPETAADFARDGGTAFGTCGELAAAVDVLVGVVVNAAQVEAVLFGAEGAADRLRPGSVFVMCSTVDPGWSAALEGRLAERGVLYLDAPISGGAVRAAAGELTMMTSGSTEAYSLADPVLEAMSSTVYRLGGSAGLGSKVKIVNQLLAGVHIAVAAEAMALGIKAGVPAEALYEVITHSAGNSWMFENRMAHVLDGDYTPLSAVDIFVKDLGLVLDAARPERFPLPLAATAHQMFLQASASGLGAEDDSAVIKIFPGVDLPEPVEA